MSNQKEQRSKSTKKGEEKLFQCEHKDCVARSAHKVHQEDLQTLMPPRSNSPSPY